MVERVIQLISEVGGIGSLGPDIDIYRAGFSSVGVLDLLLKLEDEFHVTIPDKEFMTARTPEAIAGLIERLRQEQPA
jgi:acyl carrier protein